MTKLGRLCATREDHLLQLEVVRGDHLEHFIQSGGTVHGVTGQSVQDTRSITSQLQDNFWQTVPKPLLAVVCPQARQTVAWDHTYLIGHSEVYINFACNILLTKAYRPPKVGEGM